MDTSHQQQLFGHRGPDDANALVCRDEAHQYRDTTPGHLPRGSVWLADLGFPVAQGQ